MSAKKGNNPQLWNELLEILDERLQLGLLEHLKRVKSYHFEDNSLFIEAPNEQDYEYLNREAVLQQLQTFAADICKVEKLIINKAEQ